MILSKRIQKILNLKSFWTKKNNNFSLILCVNYSLFLKIALRFIVSSFISFYFEKRFFPIQILTKNYNYFSKDYTLSGKTIIVINKK